MTHQRGTKHGPAPKNSAHYFSPKPRIRRSFAASILVPQSQSTVQSPYERQEEAQQSSLVNARAAVAAQESDEWIKTLPDGKRVRFSYQLLTSGYWASAEILEPVDAAMTYTHIQTDLPAPIDRAQIEAEFIDDLTH